MLLKRKGRGRRHAKRRPGRKSKIDLKTEKVLVSPYRSKISVFLYRLAILLIVGAVFYLVFFSSALMVEDILVFGANDEKLNEEEEMEIISLTKPLLEGKILDLVPRKHFFFVRSGKIKEEILNEFKSYKSVEIKRQLFGKLKIEIKKKDIFFLLCGDTECTPIDNKGVAMNRFPRTDIFQYGAELPLVIDESNSVVEPGSGVSSEEQLNLIINVRREVEKTAGVMIEGLYMPLPSASELKAKTTDGWLIYFSTDNSAKRQIEALKINLEKEIPEEDKICLEYVDLRIKNKIYYKLYDDCENLKRQREEEAKRKEEEEKQRIEDEKKQKEEELKQQEKEAKEKTKEDAKKAKEEAAAEKEAETEAAAESESESSAEQSAAESASEGTSSESGETEEQGGW